MKCKNRSFSPECCLSFADSTITLIYPDVNIQGFLYSRLNSDPEGKFNTAYPEKISLTKQSFCIGSKIVTEIKNLIDAAIMTSTTYEYVSVADGTSYKFYAPSGKSAYCGTLSDGNCAAIAGQFEQLSELLKSESCEKIAECIPEIKRLTSSFKRLGIKPPQDNIDPFIPRTKIIIPVFTDDTDFSTWVNKRISYPKEMKENKIEGTVLLSFTILKDGTLQDINVLSSPHQTLTDITVKIVESSPLWKPAMDRKSGLPIDCKVAFPVIFSLRSEH